MTNLGEALPQEMARVRDKIMPVYQSIGPSGIFALALMQQALDDAAKAMVEGDIVAMLRAYQTLKDFDT